MNILIAGGTGLIGGYLGEYLTEQGHNVKVLTRNPTAENHIKWDPIKREIEIDKIIDTEILINLCGEGIGDKRWTKKRKRDLQTSRIVPIEFLFEIHSQFPKLRQFISTSGITCYGFENRPTCYSEEDEYGDSFVDRLVQKWERAISLFSNVVPTATLRFGVVLSDRGGALSMMLKPIKMGFGAVIGSGNQIIPWIHIDDLTSFVSHSIDAKLEGTFNLNAGNTNNRNLTIGLAKKVHKRIWLPRIPGFLVRLIFGQMSLLLLKGVCVDNSKAIQSGFQFKFDDLDKAFDNLDL